MRRLTVLLFIAVLLAAFTGAVDSSAGKKKRSKQRRPAFVRDAVPAMLLGSPEALATENRMVDKFGLERFADLAALRRARERGDLVPVTGRGRVVPLDHEIGAQDPDHAREYHAARPWVQWFLDDLAADTSLPPDVILPVTSLVRTEEYQRRLRRVSLNAARGDTPLRRSSHLTGSTVDITTRDMSPETKQWMRQVLTALERRGLVQATEERHGSTCFHVMVFPTYKPGTRLCAAACHE